ncbi:MAG: hypothetical protein EXS63_07210 [Candidatus Omnitrophica bacterium]|nr:hypothetical protein [Candidatus Omnitrophota bacterium]
MRVSSESAVNLLMKRNPYLLIAGLSILCFLSGSPAAKASTGGDVSLMLRGATKIVGSAFQVPANMLGDSMKVMFPFGLLTGAVKGTAKTVAGTLGGVVDIARGGAPYAKYLIFL